MTRSSRKRAKLVALEQNMIIAKSAINKIVQLESDSLNVA